MPLTYNEKTGDFVLASNDDERAKAVGLTLSRRVRSHRGERIWFTKDAYAALPYWSEADARARSKLTLLYEDYRASYAIDTKAQYPSPEGMEYLPFQRAGIEYALGKLHCLIGDEPGLGKTIQAIGVANATSAKKILVICPGRVRLHWRREVLKWSTLDNVSTQVIVTSKGGLNPRANYVMISYDLARRPKIHKVLCNIDWDILVLDEAHYLKTSGAKRTQAIFGGGRGVFKERYISKHASRIIGLTGTPLPNRPRECYTVAKGLCWESIDWMTYDAFCYRFNPTVLTPGGDTVEKHGRLPELHARLRANFMVRRSKEAVLKDLPDKRYELTYVESNGRIRDVLTKERMLNFTVKDLKAPNAKMFGQISTLRREMGEAMAPRVVDHLRYLLDVVELQKIVVFAHHKSVMDFIGGELAQYGVVEIRGGMSLKAGDASVQAFQKADGPRIFLGQMQASGEGIDGLQNAASHVVFAEPSWVPKDNEQCVDRCHRIGQHDNVVAQIMLVEGSLCEKILATVIRKTHVIHDVLDKEISK